MTWKVGAPVVVLLAGVLLSRTIHFDRHEDRIERREAVVFTKPALATVDGVRVFPSAQPARRENRRNLFAFPEIQRPVRKTVVRTVTTTPRVVEQKTDKTEQPQPRREPEFPMRFIGTFGVTKDPIAVFTANGDVVNAKIGDVVAGEFRLSAIGIESVEVSTSRGTVQRVLMTR